MSNPILTKLIYDFISYSEIFPLEGHVPIDTAEWLDVLFCHEPTPKVESEMEYIISKMEQIVQTARDNWAKFDFEIKVIPEKQRIPHKYWLRYCLKAEYQE